MVYSSTIGVNNLDKGYRVTGAVVNLATALVANAVIIFIVSNNVNQIGTKSFKPRKLMVQNLNAGACFLYLGTYVGAVWAETIPAVRVLGNIDNEWYEYELPGVEHFTNMYAYMDTLVAGGSLNIQVEGEEIG